MRPPSSVVYGPSTLYSHEVLHYGTCASLSQDGRWHSRKGRQTMTMVVWTKVGLKEGISGYTISLVVNKVQWLGEKEGLGVDDTNEAHDTRSK